MLLDDEIIVSCNAGNMKHYQELGYNALKRGDKIKIKTEHLMHGSPIRVSVKCDGCGKESSTFYMSYITTKSKPKNNGMYLCLSCTHKRDIMEVLANYFEHNCMPLFSSEDYITEKSILRYQCGTHKLVIEASYRNFSRNKYKCPLCLKEGFGGANHHQYKDGTNGIKSVLRSSLVQWSKQVTQAYEGLCQLTGAEGHTHVHHLNKPFTVIFYETLIELGLPVKSHSDNYTLDEVFRIQKTVLAKHFKEVVGLPISEGIHMLFHSIYRDNPSKENFDEFALNYPNRLYEPPKLFTSECIRGIND